MTSSSLKNWLTASLRKDDGIRPPSLKTLSLLTVVIPCYDRQDFLLRQCVYWHGSGAAVVIVDGSPQALGEDLRQTLSGLADITYLHSATSMMERLRLASGRIQTPYAILLGDDEFLLFTGLCSAIAQLEQDATLVACIAQSLAFFPSGDGASCTYGTGYPHWRYSVRQDDIQTRLVISMSDYTAATCYAVLRTTVWRKSWGQLQNWSSPYVGEMQQALTTYICGKLATVDEVYWMRSNENRPITSNDFNRGLSFHEWWLSHEFKEENDKFIALLSDELVNVQHMERSMSEATIREAVAAYITHMNDISQKKNVEALTNLEAAARKLRAVIVKVLKRLLPSQLLRRLKSVLFGLRGGASDDKGALGNLAGLKQNSNGRHLLFNDELAAELVAMEALIASFYAARRSPAR